MRSARSGSSLMAKMPRLVRGHQAVVHGLRVAEGAALGHLDRVDVADQVADAGVRRGQLLAVAVARGAARRPGCRRRARRPAAARQARDGLRSGCVVDLAAGDDRRPLVEQADEGADQAGLALAALAEEDEVVAGEQRALELGQHGVLEADDAREARARRGRSRASRLSRISALTGRRRRRCRGARRGWWGRGSGCLRGDVRHLATVRRGVCRPPDHGTTARS